jgi:hypothetical protein
MFEFAEFFSTEEDATEGIVGDCTVGLCIGLALGIGCSVSNTN